MAADDIAKATDTVYDQHAAFYIDFVDRNLASGDLDLTLDTMRACIGDRIADARVCDVCCGEGYLGRYLLAHGVRAVVGVDLSAMLIDAAKRWSTDGRLSYHIDDAHVVSDAPKP
jgi:2-polyprenyl-3-methyl-5-hydroxy-6-metoxy-1,4-benzoquinol methylase